MTEKEALSRLVNTLLTVKRGMETLTHDAELSPAVVSELKFLITLIDKAQLMTAWATWIDWMPDSEGRN